MFPPLSFVRPAGRTQRAPPCDAHAQNVELPRETNTVELPANSFEHYFNALRAFYLEHKDGVDALASKFEQFSLRRFASMHFAIPKDVVVLPACRTLCDAAAPKTILSASVLAEVSALAAAGTPIPPETLTYLRRVLALEQHQLETSYTLVAERRLHAFLPNITKNIVVFDDYNPA